MSIALSLFPFLQVPSLIAASVMLRSVIDKKHSLAGSATFMNIIMPYSVDMDLLVIFVPKKEVRKPII